MTDAGANPGFEDLLRDLAPQVLGSVLRRFRDFSSAEDAVQEALIAAAAKWPRDGMPENPRAWLTQVALRRMTDTIRTALWITALLALAGGVSAALTIHSKKR